MVSFTAGTNKDQHSELTAYYSELRDLPKSLVMCILLDVEPKSLPCQNICFPLPSKQLEQIISILHQWKTLIDNAEENSLSEKHHVDGSLVDKLLHCCEDISSKCLFGYRCY